MMYVFIKTNGYFEQTSNSLISNGTYFHISNGTMVELKIHLNANDIETYEVWSKGSDCSATSDSFALCTPFISSVTIRNETFYGAVVIKPVP